MTSLKAACGCDAPRKPNPIGDGGEADELLLYMDNERALYPQKKEILRNLGRKLAKGTYDRKKAPLLWAYWVEAGAKKYARDHATPPEWAKMFPRKVRMIVAEDLAAREEQMLRAGEYPDYYPGDGPRQENPLLLETPPGFTRIGDDDSAILYLRPSRHDRTFRVGAITRKNDPTFGAVFEDSKGEYHFPPPFEAPTPQKAADAAEKYVQYHRKNPISLERDVEEDVEGVKIEKTESISISRVGARREAADAYVRRGRRAEAHPEPYPEPGAQRGTAQRSRRKTGANHVAGLLPGPKYAKNPIYIENPREARDPNERYGVYEYTEGDSAGVISYEHRGPVVRPVTPRPDGTHSAPWPYSQVEPLRVFQRRHAAEKWAAQEYERRQARYTKEEEERRAKRRGFNNNPLSEYEANPRKKTPPRGVPGITPELIRPSLLLAEVDMAKYHKGVAEVHGQLVKEFRHMDLDARQSHMGGLGFYEKDRDYEPLLNVRVWTSSATAAAPSVGYATGTVPYYARSRFSKPEYKGADEVAGAIAEFAAMQALPLSSLRKQ